MEVVLSSPVRQPPPAPPPDQRGPVRLSFSAHGQLQSRPCGAQRLCGTLEARPSEVRCVSDDWLRMPSGERHLEGRGFHVSVLLFPSGWPQPITCLHLTLLLSQRPTVNLLFLFLRPPGCQLHPLQPSNHISTVHSVHLSKPSQSGLDLRCSGVPLIPSTLLSPTGASAGLQLQQTVCLPLTTQPHLPISLAQTLLSHFHIFQRRYAACKAFRIP